MKWGGYNPEAAERLNGAMKKVFSGRVLSALITLVTLGMILGATAKWNP